MKTKIEWADITINPIVGCSHCSPGCDHCYAERFAFRLARNPQTAAKYRGVVDERGRWTGKINLHMDGCLHAATVTRKPKRFFIGSMTDIFHENIPDEEIRNLFLSIAIVPNHLPIYMVLTKRPQRAQAILGDMLVTIPELHRIWLGVTVCNQAEADAKIPVLLDIPAAKRFVSVEPMLGPVDLHSIYSDDAKRPSQTCGIPWGHKVSALNGQINYGTYFGGRAEFGKLNWVIVGGETGPGARPMHPDWARFLRDQCQEADVPFFFKSWGDWVPCSQLPNDFPVSRYPVGDIGTDGIFIPPPVYEIPLRNRVSCEDTLRVGKKYVGRLLDGREWNEVPDEN